MVGYKLFRTMKTQKGKIFPLYVNANEAIPIGVWIDAKEGERAENGKVKSRLNLLAFRPGWHINDGCPYVTHIGIKGASGEIEFLNPQHVWAEVEYSDEINYQEEANANGWKNGKFNPRDADLDHIPVNGFYKYKTNPNMFGSWVIAGSMKVNRLLSDAEVIELCETYSLHPMERFGGNCKLSQLGF